MGQEPHETNAAEEAEVAGTPGTQGASESTGAPESTDDHDWAAYYRYTLGREPRPLFLRGFEAVAATRTRPGTAVEVGFGDGTETMVLLQAGWRVTAIDSAEAAAEVLAPRVPDDARDRLMLLTAAAGDVELPPLDLLYSAYVLSYLSPDDFARLWARTRAGLRPGGFVVVNIFGDRHEWAGEPGTTFLPRAEVERLLDGLEVLVLDEVEEEGSSFRGPTHWHYFDIVAPAAGVSAPDRSVPPSVERVLQIVRAQVEVSEPAALTALARRVVDEERERLANGAPPSGEGELADAVVELIDAACEADLVMPPRVINATGVVLHTNLGRAPWPRAARLAAIAGASAYGYLELDEATGRRGPRFRAAEEHLVALTGAEDALVVTNNAAALLLAVGLAGRRGAVVVSRGELVEIGGGVRVPEIVVRAGAKLIEVGTTNRTRAADFEAPLAEGRATAVLRVHPSNFAMEGFTEAADLAEVAAIAHRHGAIVIDDLGSGALLDTATFGLAHEPTPAERLAAGADVVLFSGDKLVGGPQAGLVVGRRDLVAKLRRDPLARAVRPDKAILAAVATTLGIYVVGRAAMDIPVWKTIALDPERLRTRAEWIRGLCRIGDEESGVRVVEVRSPVGGGSLPGQTLPSVGVAVSVASPARAAVALRRGSPRILARVEGDELVFDLRTVPRFNDGDLVRAINGLGPRRT